jgi:hypothetical protein
MPQCVVIGTPGDRRIELFQQALAASGFQPARLVSYLDLLAGEPFDADMLTPATIVRIESPGNSSNLDSAHNEMIAFQKSVRDSLLHSGAQERELGETSCSRLAKYSMTNWRKARAA